jgi:hypothetical protein
VALAVGSVTERLTLTRDESKVLEFIESIRNTQVRPPPPPPPPSAAPSAQHPAMLLGSAPPLERARRAFST